MAEVWIDLIVLVILLCVTAGCTGFIPGKTSNLTASGALQESNGSSGNIPRSGYNGYTAGSYPRNGYFSFNGDGDGKSTSFATDDRHNPDEIRILRDTKQT
jgi:hypothetical protein